LLTHLHDRRLLELARRSAQRNIRGDLEMPGGVRGQAVLHEFIRQDFDRISLSDPNETASQVFESRGVRAKFFQARFNPLDLTERFLIVLSKSRCELGIGAAEPLRKMVQGVDSRPFHSMGIAQPSNEPVRLACHGLTLSSALTKGSIWSREPPLRPAGGSPG